MRPPLDLRWSFFKSTREWREGTLSTRSACEAPGRRREIIGARQAESCYPQPWIPTKEQCDKVSHCQADCPYCETVPSLRSVLELTKPMLTKRPVYERSHGLQSLSQDQYWDWDTKQLAVRH